MNVRIVNYCDRSIEICLWLVIFCLPFAKAGVETFVWLGIFLWLLKRGFGYRTEGLRGLLPKTPLNKAIAVFLLINALTTVFSVNFGLSFKALFGKETKFVILFFMVLETIMSTKQLKRILMVMILSASLTVTDAAVQLFSGVDFLRGYAWARLTASFPSANGFGCWLAVFIPFFGGILAGKGKDAMSWKIKAIVIVLMILLLFCLLLTYSRGAWLGTLASCFVVALYFVSRLNLRERRVLFLVFAGLLMTFWFFQKPLKSIIGTIENLSFHSGPTIKERVESRESFVIRTNLWKEALSIIEDFPLLGSGLNTYSRVAPYYKIAKDGGIYPHNSFLQMAAETGLLGLFSFLWILFEFFRWGWRHVSRHKDYLVLGLMSGISAFLVQSFVDTNLYALQLVVLFWFMLGLTTAMINVESKDVSCEVSESGCQ